jgi:hypothetical protein
MRDGASSSLRIALAAEALQAWLLRHGYCGYDPFDGLNSVLRPFAVGAKGRQILLQGVRRFPGNIRPLLGIKPSGSSKGAAYIARAQLKLAGSDPALGGMRDEARTQFDWLVGAVSPGYSGPCWGNHFDYQSRVFWLPKGEPTVVWTALCGHAFIDAWEQLHEKKYLEIAEGVRTFVLTDLERRPEGGGACISYIPREYHAVHNASMLAAGFLARLDPHSPNPEALSVARDALAYTVGCQHRDGSWWYGEEADLHWVDSFHTGYVLDSLWWYMIGSGDTQYVDAFNRGAWFFVENFFLASGLPKYYPRCNWPIDIQCAAQGIETITLLSGVIDASLLELAQTVAEWTITHMQDRDGHFYFQIWPWATNKTPMLHWGQATMLHALSRLLVAQTELATGTTAQCGEEGSVHGPL